MKQIFTAVIFHIIAMTAFCQTGGDFTRAMVAREVIGNNELRSRQPGVNPDPVFKASDFGLTPAASPEQKAAGLDLITLTLTEKSASALVLEKGDYRIQLRPGKPGMALRSLKDFVIAGNGARLLFRDSTAKGDGHPGFIVMRNCQRILLKDFSFGVDWDEKTLSLTGRVIAVDSGKITYQIVSGEKLKTDWEIRSGFEWQMNYDPAPDRAPHRCRMVFDCPVPPLSTAQAKEYLLMRDFGNPGAYLIQNNTLSKCLRHGIWAGSTKGQSVPPRSPSPSYWNNSSVPCVIGGLSPPGMKTLSIVIQPQLPLSALISSSV